MTKRMLIDATHSEETRVAIVEDNRLEEFEYESAARKPLKGNIYLAKVTRVEPSLQAAFVNFGGNRHAFLPFSEIHPDYFRIPVADREALLAEQQAELEEHDKRAREAEEAVEAAAAAAEDEEITDVVLDDAEDSAEDETLEKPKSKAKPKARGRAKKAEKVEGAEEEVAASDIKEDEEETKPKPKPKRGRKSAASKVTEVTEEVDGNVSFDDGESDVNGNKLDDDGVTDADGNVAAGGEGEDRPRHRGGRDRGDRGGRNGRGRGRGGRGGRQRNYDNEDDETRFRFSLRRKYKIQEVVKRGQIMLIQVSKEERGNKGAAVTTYLSLPGRYCVLMPNSPRGGGVSRKVSSYKDRAKMKEMLKDLQTPQGMSMIVRTAGVSHTKTEVKRDLDYLMRLWDNIRALTMESTAPALVYEEADLIKRAVRDLYSKDIDEVYVAGEKGYKTAKDFMKLMMPSHAKNVTEYQEDGIPLFSRYQVEGQIMDIGETEVTLPSGGYLVINPTEALISVDVNSGRATKERHIESTALKTNLEAADEVARQLRLRDLGGLVVIDFIDMEDRRNNGKVERRMRDALANDRARIQVGRISNFGLMELSRQRLNPSLSETQFELCPRCEGRGRVRTADALSILVLRAIEEEGARKRAAEVIVHVSNDVAIYILNHKRSNLVELEARYGLSVLIRVDDELGATNYRVEVSRPVSKDGEDEPERRAAVTNEGGSSEEDSDDNKPSRRRGRRGGRGRDRDRDQEQAEEVASEKEKKEETQPEESASEEKAPVEKPKRGRKAPVKKAEERVDEKADEKALEEEKPAKKKPVAKKPATKKAEASNDDQPKAETKEVKVPPPEEAEARKFETVNEAPKSKKKGWWSR